MAEASDFSSPSVNGITEADKIESRYATYRDWNQKELALKLAISGFLYIGIGDKVKCETCGIQVDKLMPSYDAIETHRKYSPNCSYINKWFGGKNKTKPKNVEPEIPPEYPSYESYQTRLDSYSRWPLNHAHQSPSSMAAEGFFYLGSADRVRCFQCGITLRDWDKDDFPLEAHVTWSPDCQFAQQRQELASREVSSNSDERNTESNTLSIPTEENKIKEQRSVRKSEDATAETTTDTLDGGNTNRNESSVRERSIIDVPNDDSDPQGAAILDTEDSVNSITEADESRDELGNYRGGAVGGIGNDDDDVMSGVHSPMVQAVLEFGRSIENVRKAIQQKTGRNFTDAESLFAAILDMEDSGNSITEASEALDELDNDTGSVVGGIGNDDDDVMSGVAV